MNLKKSGCIRKLKKLKIKIAMKRKEKNRLTETSRQS